MKFRFCGGQDAPDWLLTEIATISEVDAKIVSKLVDIVMRDLVEKSFEKAAAVKAAGKSLSESALKACISGLNFILTNAAKHDVDAGVLITEIQQLGLPKALSEIIQESFAGSKEAAQATFRKSGLRFVALRQSLPLVHFALPTAHLTRCYSLNAPGYRAWSRSTTVSI